MPTALAKDSDAELFLRLWDKQKLTPTLARHLLKIEFGDQDRARMHELAQKNEEGELSPAEQREFENYVRVGTLLSILQSRARKRLKSRAGNGRG